MTLHTDSCELRYELLRLGLVLAIDLLRGDEEHLERAFIVFADGVRFMSLMIIYDQGDWVSLIARLKLALHANQEGFPAFRSSSFVQFEVQLVETIPNAAVHGYVAHSRRVEAVSDRFL